MPISLQKKVKPKTISKILKDQKNRGKSKKCQKWRKQQFEVEPKKYVTNFKFSYIELWTDGLWTHDRVFFQTCPKFCHCAVCIPSS